MSGVLVVCHANVCRSPLAAAALLTVPALASAGVTSRGTDAVADAAMCEVSEATAAGLSIPVLADHLSTRLTRRSVADADLVLTAELQQRGMVARMSPTARSRTFTLLEAVALARELEALGGSRLAGVAELAAAMHDARGMARPLEHLDLKDGHGRSLRVHRAATRAVGHAALDFAGLAGRLLAPGLK